MVTKCWKSVLTFWCRCAWMDASRLNKIIFCWANFELGSQCKNWHFRRSQTLLGSSFGMYRDINENRCKVEVLRNVLRFIIQRYINQWTADINRENACMGNGENKLRFYRTFKQVFYVESYCKIMFNRLHREQFRSGTAPIAIKTGRYNGLNVNERKCFSCKDTVEDEIHVLLHCPEYRYLHDEILYEAEQIVDSCTNLSDAEKISSILTNTSIIKASARTCFFYFKNKRCSLLYS